MLLESLEAAFSEAILLTAEVYGGVVNVFREARDLCIEGDDNGVDLVTDETDYFHDDINSGCFPLCQTDRSEISGNTRGKWKDISD